MSQLKSLPEILQELREFRASQPKHDLSVFRYRNEGHPFCAGGWVKDDEQEPVKRTKKSKKQVGSEGNE